MEAIIERVGGMDVGQATVVGTVLVGVAPERAKKETRTFRTVTRELLDLREWLLAKEVSHVAMEGTGIYGQPVYSRLEDALEMILGNAQPIKNVPGRKTDVKESEWLAELVRHGLIAQSFVPPKPLRRLLETANIKLASVRTDVFGVSGRWMLTALIDGAATPAAMAALAKGVLRKKAGELQEALEGRLEEHHRFLLQLRRLDQADADLATLDACLDDALTPYQEPGQRLQQSPGVSRVVAAVIGAELGMDMTVFRSAQHAAAWAGVCPGNNESAGKRKRGGRGGVTSTCERHSWRRRLRHPTRRAAISGTSSTVSAPVGAPSERPWPSATGSSSPPITCSPRVPRTETSARPTSTALRSAGPRAISCIAWSASATRSPSGHRQRRASFHSSRGLWLPETA